MSTEHRLAWSGAEPLTDFLNGVPCSLLSTTSDGLILGVNDMFLAWTGYERREIVGVRRFDELLSVPSRMYHETHYAPLLRIQGFVSEVALDISRRDGSLLPVFVNAAAKQRSDGTTELMRIAIFGASARRKYEHELLLERRSSEEAVRAKADFLAMFAHEIRNPLHAMFLQAELMQYSTLSSEDADTVNQLRDSLGRVLRLLNSMLDISKLEAGKATLQRTEFEIGDVVQAVVHSFRALAERRQLALAMHVDPELSRRVIGDPVKLDQALTNLVSNAIKFTEQGSVTVAATRIHEAPDSVEVRFWVEDTGIGIPVERHAQIFEDYEQADPRISQRYGGTGLGLAITRKLINLQGGQLRVSSAEGKGATFLFDLRFPIAEGA